MKKTLLPLFLLLLSTASVYGQVAAKQQPTHVVEKCSQHNHMAEMQQNDPARFATMNLAPNGPKKQQYQTPISTEKLTGLVYTVPVVFHVIHNNGVENISEAQMLNALAILNRDFRKQNADTANVQAVFQGMPSDVEIEFKLATVAPNGACFNGITRTVSALTNNGSSGQNQVNAIIAGNDVFQGVWPHNRYLNVYVAADLGGAAGYTFLPNGNSAATAQNMYFNGVFMLHDYTGAIGTSSATNSRALTHEVGHWLNLSHTWGSTNQPGVATNCNDDDGVQDTPNCVGVTSCSLNSNTCNSDDAFWGMAMKDNVENYMDYSYCSKMFTQGQVTRMRTAIVSSVGGRSNIWTNANLQLVGAIPGSSLCALDFSANATTVCAGSTITFTPNTTSGIATYSWSFPGGTPSTSTAANPTVTYNTAGTYNATLTVTATSNGASYNETKNNYIVVNNNTIVSLPISEGFTAATFPAGWTIVNPNGTGTTWARTTAAGRAPTAGNSMMFDNFNYNDPTDDEVQLPKFSTTSMNAATLVFDVAYAPYDANNFDGLEVLVSTDCGSTFTTVYSKSYTTLATANATTGQFTPSTAQWRSETVDLTPFVGQSSVLVSFKNLSGYGNRLFVDNINITGVTGSVPAPVASFTSSTNAVCAGQSVTFTNTSTGTGNTYAWSFPGGTPSTSTATNPTVTYPTAGTYNVSLTATNTGGNNTATQNNSITVNPAPTAAITAGGPISFCEGGSVVLSSSANTGNNWSTGSTNPSITVFNSGTYTVTVTANGCSATSNPTTVTVNANPVASLSPIPAVCLNASPFTLTQGTPAGGTYSGSGVTGNQFNPAAAGIGSTPITYTFTNANGCTDNAVTTIQVNGCASIEENALENVSIYPNPSNGTFTITAGEQVIETISVYNNLGQLIWSEKVNNNQFEISVPAFAQGIYTVRVQAATGVQTLPVYLNK